MLRFSIAGAVLLFVIKFITALLTHSLAVMASALDSFLDITVSTVNFIAARSAAKPPDNEHTYGHEKIESLAGLFQSLLIGLSGCYLVFESLRRMISGETLENIPVGFAIMLISLFVSILIVVILKRALRKNRSLILESESLHFTSDIAAHGGVLLALLLFIVTRWVFWDILVSVLIAFYIFKSAYAILMRSVHELLDASLPPQEVRSIHESIYAFDPSIVGVHNFRSRRVGGKVFMDFHIEIRGIKDFKAAHGRTEALISFLREKYPQADLTVHFDPEGES